MSRTKLIGREAHHRDARLFIVATEGEATEPAYFGALQQAAIIPPTRVKLRVLPPEDGRSSPEHLVERVQACLGDPEVHFKPDFDWVWLVLDTDFRCGGRREKLYSLIHTCEQTHWLLALSNPCFEAWLILHVASTPAAAGEAPKADEATEATRADGATKAGEDGELPPPTSTEMVTRLRAVLGGYQKATVPAACVDEAAVRAAIVRARDLDTDPLAPWPMAPGSRVYLLMEQLLGR